MIAADNIGKFYDIDGVDYAYRRWARNRIAKFDFDCTKAVISREL